ncbi:hypothetical protein SPSIL_057470 [Sporomusa silvacetica DSM 10669]|uniref:PBSX phage terminase small subunit-like N-terminal domain-containing protein n=1 Tax=Sporomusa silvacetica DSM 10669 TaxID=1123289 RepID=A0ABZ3IVQ7_9FIRM|nr:phage terminase small subunit [Sporomusa silvacetica]OZC14305.1 phage terminase small subunit [Sporomusa silvacetica DSM 10669]
MARIRSPERDKAFEIWKDSGGQIPLVEIATTLEIPDVKIRKWKNVDKWDDRLKGNAVPIDVPIARGNVPLEIDRSVPKPKKTGPPFGSQNAKGHGAPKGNKNAVGNSGGIGGMPGERNQNFKHGFFSKIFPDDPDTQEIIESIQVKSPIEVLWENIVIQYTAIARAQRIMFVKDQDDLTKVLKSSTSGEKSDSVTYELQFAWDKQATFITAQSRAMKTLEGLIKQYVDLTGDKGKLEIEKLKADIDRAKSEGDGDTVAQDHAKRVQEAWANR